MAQKEANIWMFGNFAGLDFNTSPPTATTSSKMKALEGCASIADSDGNLLFYSNGKTVWNNNHSIMLNGESLNGHLSTTQSCIIVKKPKSQDIYYLFTVGSFGEEAGLSYSEVDASLNNGHGIVRNPKNIQLESYTCEKVTAIKHQNNRDYWIITQKYNTNSFYSFLLTENGINKTNFIESKIGPIADESKYAGYLKSSLDGSRLIYANNNEIALFEFNNLNGVISNSFQ